MNDCSEILYLLGSLASLPADSKQMTVLSRLAGRDASDPSEVQFHRLWGRQSLMSGCPQNSPTVFDSLLRML